MKLSLTQFVDVVARSGMAKARHVWRIQRQLAEAYTPAKDLYKQLREAIVECHTDDDAKQSLHQFMANVLEPRRRARYPALIRGYLKWLRGKPLSFFEPPRAVYSHAGVTVGVNAEVGLRIDEVPYVIKLYFKKDRLSKSNAEVIAALMVHALKIQPAAKVAVLDVERAKLHEFDSSSLKNVKAMVDAELAYIATIWPDMPEAA